MVLNVHRNHKVSKRCDFPPHFTSPRAKAMVIDTLPVVTCLRVNLHATLSFLAEASEHRMPSGRCGGEMTRQRDAVELMHCSLPT